MKRSYPKFLKRLEEAGLREEIEKRALAAHVPLVGLYSGNGSAPSVGKARKSVYAWLAKQGKGLNEIARLFDRAPSGVAKLIHGKES